MLDKDGVLIEYVYGVGPAPVAYQVRGENVRWFTDGDHQWVAEYATRVDDPNFGETEFHAMMAEFSAQFPQAGTVSLPLGILAVTPPETHDACVARIDSFFKNAAIVCAFIARKNPFWGGVCAAAVAAADALAKLGCPPPDNGSFEYIWCRKSPSPGIPSMLPGSHPENCGPDPDPLLTAACLLASPLVYATDFNSTKGGLQRNASCYYVAPSGLPEWVFDTDAQYWVICGNGRVGNLAEEWSIGIGNDPQQLARVICNE